MNFSSSNLLKNVFNSYCPVISTKGFLIDEETKIAEQLSI